MTGRVLYNEIDPYAAAWLSNLAAESHVAPGQVDTRSIVDLRPSDLDGVTQFHAFAGVGGWSLALRLAGVPDDFPVWTGSCPCQPFSSAGQRKGFDDSRHLWPVWFGLIRKCRPAIVLGEQVEAAVRLGWLDAVFADMEGEGYACGAVVLGAHSVGAPHIRQRLWFVAHAGHGAGREPRELPSSAAADEAAASREGRNGLDGAVAHRGATRRVADAGRERHDRSEDAGADRGHPSALPGGRQGLAGLRESEGSGAALSLGNAERVGLRGAGCGPDAGAAGGVPPTDGQRERLWPDAGAAGGDAGRLGDAGAPGLSRGECQELSGARWRGEGRATEQPGRPPWSDLDWLSCRDGKVRPTQPGLQPLAHGLSGRVGKLRAAGNAIVPQVAAEFIAAALDLPSPATRQAISPAPQKEE